ncbi:MAG: DUF3788 domain-containing protein [Promethearchaeota archaeon]|jgi:hypothetical protein
MLYDRFLDKGKTPKIEEIKKNIGDKLSLWLELREYLDNRYDFTNEFIFFTKKYGWSYRYKRKQRTMLYLFPEKGAFSILIVLGKKESEEVNEIRDQLNEQIRSTFDKTEQLHDGRWLWIRILSKSDLDSLKILLSAKHKPLKK